MGTDKKKKIKPAFIPDPRLHEWHAEVMKNGGYPQHGDTA